MRCRHFFLKFQVVSLCCRSSPHQKLSQSPKVRWLAVDHSWYAPLKINGWNLKVTQMRVGKSSEPNQTKPPYWVPWVYMNSSTSVCSKTSDIFLSTPRKISEPEKLSHIRCSIRFTYVHLVGGWTNLFIWKILVQLNWKSSPTSRGEHKTYMWNHHRT